MIDNKRSLFSRISFKSAIISNNLFKSSSIFCLSKPARRCNCISRIALACLSDILNSSINLVWMISVVRLDLIKSIIASIWSRALFNPSKIWARSSALVNLNLVRRLITSSWWSRYKVIISFRFNVFGSLLTKAMQLAPKVVCNDVNLYNWFKITSGWISRRNSITTRIPSRFDSSRISVIPSIFFSRTNCDIFSIIRALLTI